MSEKNKIAAIPIKTFLTEEVDFLHVEEGITKVVNVITGGNCNCDKRQEWLNQKIPYNKK